MKMNHLKLFESSDDLSDDNDVLENLVSILRKYIRNAGLEPYVSYEDGEIYVQFILDQVETMPHLMKVMKLINKLRTDILIQYDCEFDLAETRDEQPLITALFSAEKQRVSSRSNAFDDDEPYTFRTDDDVLKEPPF